MKKIISAILCMVISFSLMPSAFAVATEPERIQVEVDTFEDAKAFFRSSEFDPTQLYSVVITGEVNYLSPRIACPNCGKAAWTGQNYKVENVYSSSHGCPNNSLAPDTVAVMHYTYLERCRSCGYEIDHNEYYFDIYCIENERAYEAWDGNSMANGDDIHECKNSWRYVPDIYK